MSSRIEHPPMPTPATPWPTAHRGFTLVEVLVVIAVIALLIALLIPFSRGGGAHAARRAQCVNNLKQIALAIHTYKDEHGVLPPAYTVDATGRPLHSWRTLVLPYLEQGSLYSEIDLSKPWDDPANAKARETALGVFRCPASDAPPNTTTYLASVGPESALAPDRPRPLAEITDGHASTLLVIEAGDKDAVHWMAPSDADEALLQKLGPDFNLPHNSGVNVVFVDGDVRFLKATTPKEARRAMTTIAGGDDAAVKDL